MSNTAFLFFSLGHYFAGFALKSAHTSTTTDRFATDVVIWCLWVAVRGGSSVIYGLCTMRWGESFEQEADQALLWT